MRLSHRLTLVLIALLSLAGLAQPAGAREKDAAIVMDAQSGKIIYERNAQDLRYPASLTKMMTLFMLFDAIEKGKVSLSTVMIASPEAASQKPTRLGLRSGDNLTVEDAIKALVVRSANDASVVIAEHLAGSEDRFAVLMTARAREIGMRNSTFRNASGLPDIDQHSTAHDMAVLARRLMTDHAKYYTYFNIRSFVWNGKTYNGHNNLLEHFEGADGLKTGYTRLSGYNLATSAMRRGVRIIGVVLGGPSAYARDVQMAEMLESVFTKLGLGRAPSVVIAMSPLVPDEDEIENMGGRQVEVERAGDFKPQTTNPQTANAPYLAPVLPRTASAPAPVQAAAIQTAPGLIRQSVTTPTAIRETVMSPIVPDDPEITGRGPRAKARATPTPTAPDAKTIAERAPSQSPLADKPASIEDLLRREDGPAVVQPSPALPRPDTRALAMARPVLKPTDAKEWGIQVGAFDEKAQAKTHLTKVKSTAKDILGKSKGVIVALTIKKATKYRVRFGPFESAKAEDVCRKLLKRKIKCGTVPDADWNKNDSGAVAPLAATGAGASPSLGRSVALKGRGG